MRMRTDKLWDLSQPVAHDGPAWPTYEPPSIRHAELLRRRAFFSAFPVLLEGRGGAWARAVAWEIDADDE
jgi:kynurenine formamidase